MRRHASLFLLYLILGPFSPYSCYSDTAVTIRLSNFLELPRVPYHQVPTCCIRSLQPQPVSNNVIPVLRNHRLNALSNARADLFFFSGVPHRSVAHSAIVLLTPRNLLLCFSSSSNGDLLPPLTPRMCRAKRTMRPTVPCRVGSSILLCLAEYDASSRNPFLHDDHTPARRCRTPEIAKCKNPKAS